MKTLLLLLALAFVTPLATTSCSTQRMSLEAGGAYSDPVLAQTDRAILDASRAMDGFIDWERTNATFLARWPEVGQLAKNITAQRDRWVRDAYAARDAYAQAATDYRKAIAAGIVGALPPSRARIDGAIAVLTSVVTQIGAHRAAHKT